MQSVLVTKSSFAKTAGVTGAAITKACRGSLLPAVKGKKIDLRTPAVWDYLHGRGVHLPYDMGGAPPGYEYGSGELPPHLQPIAPAAPPPPPGPAVLSAPPAAPPAATPEEATALESIADMTLREIVRRWGGKAEFVDWLSAMKKLGDAREKQLKNAKFEKELIPRDFVKLHVFGNLDALNRQLLHDAPKTLARRIYAAANSGQPLEDAEAITVEVISSQLKAAKASITKALREHD